MDIKNKISQLIGKEAVDSSKEIIEQKDVSDEEVIHFFNSEDDNADELSANIENKDVKDSSGEQGFLAKIKSFFAGLFNKEDKQNEQIEELDETSSTKPTNSLSQMTTIQPQQPVEEVSTVKLNDSNTINGEIDEKFSQGRSGDCVLLSSILAFSYSKKGADIIKNSITTNTNSNGEIESYSVTFAGIKETYTISKQELEAKEYEPVTRKKYSDEELQDIFGYTPEEIQNMSEDEKWIESRSLSRYSNGDSDMLLLELATQKCFNESEHPFVKAYISTEMESRKTNGIDFDVQVLDGIPRNLLSRMLTGESVVDTLSINQVEEMLNNDRPIIMGTGEKTVKIKDVNNKEIELCGQHAYAVKSATADTVTIVNPHDSSVEITLNKANLENLSGLDFYAYY